jgi:TonB-dependent receptor
MNYCSKMWVILFFIIVLSNQRVLAQEETPKQVEASISKTVEKPALSNSSMVYGPISIKLVNEPVISAIKKVAVAVRLRPVLDNDLIKKDKKVNLTLEVASLSEALDQILLGMEIQYSITESGLLIFSQEQKQENQAKGSGTIKGHVLDNQTKDPLVGANIIIQNTSLGVAADIDGNFEIKFVPDGKWNVKVSCIGYVSIIRELTIVEDNTLEQEFRLTAQAIPGEEVIVTAQARGQVQAINQQLSSDKISSVVSEARIQELPDFNAAQAISRLPGVSTLKSSGEDNKIVIRGLAPQYNAVAIDGITLASTGSTQIGATSIPGLTSGTTTNDRSIDLTMITPYMIKSIEVYKSLTPDMEANAIGGYVNMDLREAPVGLRTNLLYQSGYTQKTNKYGNYRAVASVSDRFFDDLLGVYVLGNAESYDRSADNMTATYQQASSVVGSSGYRAVRVTNVTLNRHMETRERFGGNLILDFQLPSGSIKLINTFNRLNSDFQDYNTVLNYVSTNYDIDFNYRAGKSNTDIALNSLQFTYDLKFISTDITVANSYSRNHLPLSPNYAFFQNNGISHQHSVTGDTNIVPENLTHFVNYNGDTTTLLGSTSLFSADYRENDQIYKADFKIPLRLGSFISGYLKFGGEYRYNGHYNDQSTPYIGINRGGINSTDINRQVVDAILQLHPNLAFGRTNQLLASNFTSGDPALTNSFLANKFGGIYWAANPGILNSIMDYVSHNPALRATNSIGGWFDGPYQELPTDYKYIEKYYATFLMSKLEFGSDFMVIGGARYEEDQGLFDAYNLEDERNPATQPVFPVSTTPWNHYWLPQVQAKYNISDWVDVRYSYTQTLARPDYTQLSPHFNISADSPRNIFGGNPKLKPAQAFNQDLMFTFHSNELGLLSVGGFYKEIDHFTYGTAYHLHTKAVYDKFGITGLDSLNSFAPFLTIADDDATFNTFINSQYKAYVKGIEFDFQTRFWYLPAPLNGVTLGINYSHFWSEATYPYFDEKAVRGVITKYTDSTRIGRLVFQPNDIVNASIGYDYKGFSTRLTCVFTGNSVTFIGAYPEQDGYSKDYFRIDFSARQMLPWTGLQLFFDANNLNGESNLAAQNSINGFTSQNYYGLTANLGIRFEL